MQAEEDGILKWNYSDSLTRFGIKWNLADNVVSVLVFSERLLVIEQPKGSHCNNNQYLYMALPSAKSLLIYFHLIFKTVLGGSIAIYTDDEGAEAERGEVTFPRSCSYHRVGSGPNLHLLIVNFILFALCPHYHLSGAVHYMVGSSWRNLQSKIPVRGAPVCSWGPTSSMLGVSFLRSSEISCFFRALFFFSFFFLFYSGELQSEGQCTNRSTWVEGNRCLSDKHKHVILIDGCRLTDSSQRAHLISSLINSRAQHTGSMRSSWGVDFLGGRGAYIFLLLHEKNRGPEAELKPIYALFSLPYSSLLSQLCCRRTETINLYCLCSKILAIPNNG